MNYFTSDLHAGHKNILEYEPCRPKNFLEVWFNDWMTRVEPDDTVWFLGDLVLAGSTFRTHFQEDFAELPGYKILVKGNHDKQSDGYYKNCGFDVIHPVYALFGPWLLSHFPLTCVDERRFKQVEEINTAFDYHKCEYNIHGHTHSKHSPDPRCINVSLEPWHCKLVSEEEILAKLHNE